VVRLPASVTGAPLRLSFQRRTLRPAVLSSVGPDVLLEMTRADAPVLVRSADDGTFTTVAMPTHPSTGHDRVAS
jgi:hypothetical protein